MQGLAIEALRNPQQERRCAPHILGVFYTTKAPEVASTKVIEAEKTGLLLASTPTSAHSELDQRAEICGEQFVLGRPFI